MKENTGRLAMNDLTECYDGVTAGSGVAGGDLLEEKKWKLKSKGGREARLVKSLVGAGWGRGLGENVPGGEDSSDISCKRSQPGRVKVKDLQLRAVTTGA